MKKLLLWLSLAVKVLSLLSLAGTMPGLALVPEKYQLYLGLIFGTASLSKDFCNRLGDFLDDGKINQSFKAAAILLLPVFLLASCSHIILGLDGKSWNDVLKDTAAGALKGATQSALPAYVKAKSAKEARKVTP